MRAASFDVNRTEKRCPKCGAVKPMDQFYRCRTRSDGRAGYCSSCISKYLGSGIKRRSRLKTTYGLAHGQFDEILARQGGVCAACGLPPRGTNPKELVLNVAMTTAPARCGAALQPLQPRVGMLDDDAGTVRALLLYIEATQTRSAA